MSANYKALLKQLLDHHLMTPETLTIFWQSAPTGTLRAAAGVLRYRFWGRLQGVFRLYSDPTAAAQCWEYEQTLGYRTAVAPDQSDAQSWRILPPLPFAFGSQNIISLETSPLFFDDLRQQMARHPAPSLVVLHGSAGSSTDELVRLVATIRLAWPNGSLAIRGNETKLFDLANVTFIEDEYPQGRQSPCRFDDELYRTLRSRHTPYHRFLPPIPDPSQLGALEGEAALCLRELCTLIQDEDTRVDLIRFSNHNLFTNAPRFPYRFQEHLQHVDDGHAPKLLRI